MCGVVAFTAVVCSSLLRRRSAKSQKTPSRRQSLTSEKRETTEKREKPQTLSSAVNEKSKEQVGQEVDEDWEQEADEEWEENFEMSDQLGAMVPGRSRASTPFTSSPRADPSPVFENDVIRHSSAELATMFMESATTPSASGSKKKLMLRASPSMDSLQDSALRRPVLSEGAASLPPSCRKYYTALQSYDLDPRDYSDPELMEMVLAIFYSYDVPSKMGIPLDNLRAFIQVVHDRYKSPNDVIFHNFQHVYNVLHIAYHMLRAGLDQSFTVFDVFALFVAALCHDIDHPGVNNAFMINSRSELASLYSNDAVLERHHSAVTSKILRSGSEAVPCHDILCSLPEDFKLRFKDLVSAAILATDMTHHVDKVESVRERARRGIAFDAGNEADRRELLCVLLHTADIGAQTQATAVAIKWGRTVSNEFSAQYLKEMQLGLPLSPFMAGLDEEVKFALLQTGFVSNIILPLWTAVADCFPALKVRVAMLHTNNHVYQEIVRKGVEAEAEGSKASRSCGDGGSDQGK